MTRDRMRLSVLAAVTFLFWSTCPTSAAGRPVSFIGAWRPFPAGVDPRSVVVGDFDRDGVPDLAVANGYPNTISILRGDGGGAFQTPLTSAAGSGYLFSIAAGDF